MSDAREATDELLHLRNIKVVLKRCSVSERSRGRWCLLRFVVMVGLVKDGDKSVLERVILYG